MSSASEDESVRAARKADVGFKAYKGLWIFLMWFLMLVYITYYMFAGDSDMKVWHIFGMLSILLLGTMVVSNY